MKLSDPLPPGLRTYLYAELILLVVALVVIAYRVVTT